MRGGGRPRPHALRRRQRRERRRVRRHLPRDGLRERGPHRRRGMRRRKRRRRRRVPLDVRGRLVRRFGAVAGRGAVRRRQLRAVRRLRARVPRLRRSLGCVAHPQPAWLAAPKRSRVRRRRGDRRGARCGDPAGMAARALRRASHARRGRARLPRPRAGAVPRLARPHANGASVARGLRRPRPAARRCRGVPRHTHRPAVLEWNAEWRKERRVGRELCRRHARRRVPREGSGAVARALRAVGPGGERTMEAASHGASTGVRVRAAREPKRGVER